MKIGWIAGAYCASMAESERELLRLRELGYDCIDYQGFINTETPLFSLSEDAWEAYLKEYRQRTEACGLTIHQTHGPWRSPILDADEAQRAERFEKMAKSIRGTAILGARYMAIHNLMPYGKVDEDPAYVRELNKEFFLRLSEVGKENGVVICMENMPFGGQTLARPADLLAFVSELDTPWIRLCLDVGHCTRLGESAGDAVRLWGPQYLRILHIHDNDGTRDRHWIPMDGITDWDSFSAALSEIRFDGVLSIETVLPKTEQSEESLRSEELRLTQRARAIAEAVSVKKR